jgi:outer membrane protein assembly factor BamD (BamD/ComL family)
MKLMASFIIGYSLFLFGCSKMTEDELWQKVEQSRNGSNFDSTIQVCQMIVQEYPNGRKASAALYMLGETYKDGKHDYHTAINYYQVFVKKYPDLNSTPLAMFIIGYIYNNNLQMIDSARIAYQEFVTKFPNHELASSAKFELENLGKSPDEIMGTNKDVAVKGGKLKSPKKR